MFLHEKNPRLGRISLKNLSWNNNTVTEMEDTIDIRDFFFVFFFNPRYGRHGGLVVGILDSYPLNPQK